MTKANDVLIVTRTYTNNKGIIMDLKKRPYRRDDAEKHSEKTRHPIVAVIIWNKNRDKILIAEKTVASGEKRLHGTNSIFFGEHVLENRHGSKSKNFDFSLLSKHIINDLIPEELQNADISLLDKYPRFQIFVNDDVSRSHVGYVFEGVLNNDLGNIKFDADEKDHSFRSIEEITKNYNSFNGWSRLIIDYMLKYHYVLS